MTALACIGHWYTDLLYLVPVGLIGGIAGWDKVKHSVRARGAERERTLT